MLSACRCGSIRRPRQLTTDDAGAVTGAVLHSPDKQVTVRARKGVLLAAGGFPNDVARRRELFPRTPTGKEHWTLAPKETTGDGVTLGESVGGQLDTTLASPAAWCPVSLVRYRNGRVGTYPHIVDRGKPGLIAVTAAGKRFVNEADGYYQFTTGMINATPEGEPVQAWLICDRKFQRRYPFGMSKPFPIPTWPYLRSGYLKRGKTLAELAARCGIDPQGLQQTVADFNRFAIVGEDPEFKRGTTAFNRASGDPEHQPNPSLAPLTKGPFYAIKVLPGSFGTFFGLRADADARVLDATGEPIPGLFVAGSDQANVMGGHYPSGGINIGPAMTFGYIAVARSPGCRTTRTSSPSCRMTASDQTSPQVRVDHDDHCSKVGVSAACLTATVMINTGGDRRVDQSRTMCRGCRRNPSHSRIASRRFALRTAYCAVS